jgi:hypothetical protein
MKNAANKSLTTALAPAEQGIPCFPCTLSKAPATPHGFKDASNDPLVIRELFRFRPDALIGVPTDGSSGLNVLDVDPRHGGDEWLLENHHRLPPTREHRTRSGGLHLIFRHEATLKCSAGRIASGIDVRAGGGYVIWWPAVGLHILSDAPPSPWPDWLLRRLRPQTVQPAQRVVVPDSAALHRLVQLVVAAQPGERNRLTFWAACRAGEMVASGLLSAHVAASVIAEAGTRAGLPASEAERTAWSGIRSGGGRAHA